MNETKPGWRLNPRAVRRAHDGYEFLSYSVGIGRYARYCAELDAEYLRVGGGERYIGTVFGAPLGRRFNSERNVMREIVKRATGKATANGDGIKRPVLPEAERAK